MIVVTIKVSWMYGEIFLISYLLSLMSNCENKIVHLQMRILCALHSTINKAAF